MLRYKARNYPQALTALEHEQWFEFCHARLSDGEPGILSWDQLKMRIREIDATQELTKEQKLFCSNYTVTRKIWPSPFG